MSDSFTKKHRQNSEVTLCSFGTVVKFGAVLFFGSWVFILYYHISPADLSRSNTSSTAETGTVSTTVAKPVNNLRAFENDIPFEETDESYHLVFSTGCSEFQDWQSIGIYSSAQAMGQRGIITRIASGCTKKQEESLRAAMRHLPKNTRIHFAPNTDVKDHYGHFYKYANKPLGMMHWLMHADPPVPPEATVVLMDPDFFFLKPLWHDSFSHPDKYIVTGGATKTPMPRDAQGRVRITKGSMIAQRYGIGGKPWTLEPGRNNQKAWRLDEYFKSIGRPDSPALASDLLGHENRAADFYSIGAPYFALASDWLPIATSWTNLMYMSVERNFGNLAEMYAMIIAVADYGIRPVMLDSLMVSNVDAGGEGWPWVDKLPMDRGCDPLILHDGFQLPTFLHYCQTYNHPDLGPNEGAQFSKYQVPDEILSCPDDEEDVEADVSSGGSKKMNKKNSAMFLDQDGFLQEPDIHTIASDIKGLRNIFAHCFSTRGTNQAARDYRTWFCDEERSKDD